MSESGHHHIPFSDPPPQSLTKWKPPPFPWQANFPSFLAQILTASSIAIPLHLWLSHSETEDDSNGGGSTIYEQCEGVWATAWNGVICGVAALCCWSFCMVLSLALNTTTEAKRTPPDVGSSAPKTSISTFLIGGSRLFLALSLTLDAYSSMGGGGGGGGGVSSTRMMGAVNRVLSALGMSTFLLVNVGLSIVGGMSC